MTNLPDSHPLWQNEWYVVDGVLTQMERQWSVLNYKETTGDKHIRKATLEEQLKGSKQ